MSGGDDDDRERDPPIPMPPGIMALFANPPPLPPTKTEPAPGGGRVVGYGAGRPNFCGGATMFQEMQNKNTGEWFWGRRRRRCNADAPFGQALCESCRVIEREEMAKDRARQQRKAEPTKPSRSRGGFDE